MTKRGTTNIAASIHQRLLNLAKSGGRPRRVPRMITCRTKQMFPPISPGSQIWRQVFHAGLCGVDRIGTESIGAFSSGVERQT